MSNFANTRVEQEKRDKREQSARETLGKTFHDMGKTSFAVMVIGGMSSFFGVTQVTLLQSLSSIIVGLALTFSLILVGNKIIKQK